MTDFRSNFYNKIGLKSKEILYYRNDKEYTIINDILGNLCIIDSIPAC